MVARTSEDSQGERVLVWIDTGHFREGSKPTNTTACRREMTSARGQGAYAARLGNWAPNSQVAGLISRWGSGAAPSYKSLSASAKHPASLVNVIKCVPVTLG